MSKYKLSQQIMKVSNAKIWDKAKQEWKLDRIIQLGDNDNPETCLCGHYPIKELCYIKNKFNKNIVLVGNCCVNKFIGLKSNKLFQALKKVKYNIQKSFNADFIYFIKEKGILNEWEFNFYLDTWRKRKLSEKQIIKRIQINKKILMFEDKLKE